LEWRVCTRKTCRLCDGREMFERTSFFEPDDWFATSLARLPLSMSSHRVFIGSRVEDRMWRRTGPVGCSTDCAARWSCLNRPFCRHRHSFTLCSGREGALSCSLLLFSPCLFCCVSLCSSPFLSDTTVAELRGLTSVCIHLHSTLWTMGQSLIYFYTF